MTVSDSVPVLEPGIDTSRSYPTNAGRCDKCGYYKTWGFRVLNPKSGKMMPGHVTINGHKMGDGNCPFWSARKNKDDRLEQPPPAEGFVTAGTSMAPVLSSKTEVIQDPFPVPSISKNQFISVMVGGQNVLLSKKDAFDLLKGIVNQLA